MLIRARCVLLGWAVALWLTPGCITSNTVACGDGSCPGGMVCVQQQCAAPQAALACEGLAEGQPCDASGMVGECRAGACLQVTCGDGVRQVGEACDDGNTADGDGCSADCRSNETCGNGRVDRAAGEQCDDGNTNNGDACHADCQVPRCGDGVLDTQSGEACDDNLQNSNEPNAPCRPNCQLRRCGDGVLDAVEACDDGNQVPGDGCSGDCKSEEACGNGYLDVARGEQCDDGNSDNTDACHADCKVPKCGDGILDRQNGESCDAGAGNATAPNAACRPNCQVRRCGDGVQDADEVCDDGNLASGDGCSGDCQSTERCGNGYIDVVKGEQCDDLRPQGLSGDGCSSNCLAEFARWENHSPPLARTATAVAYDARRGVLVMFGGIDDVTNATLGDTWEYDGTQWRLRRLGATPVARWLHGLTYDASLQRVVLYGGVSSSGSSLSDTWEYDGTRWVPRTASAGFDSDSCPLMYVARVAATMAVCGESRWVYDGQAWEEFVDGPPLDGAGAAYDAGRGVVVLFGGRRNGTLTRETWEFGATGWRRVMRNSPAPTARIGAKLSYDVARAKIVLIGGATGTGQSSEVWEYDGAQWVQGPARLMTGAAWAYMPELGVVGVGSWVASRATWSYDGTWQQRRAAFQPESLDEVVASDDVGGVLRFGGEPDAPSFWRLNGRAWEVLTGDEFPTARRGHMMAYDPLRRRVVLFGGRSSNDPALAETWEFDGELWRQAQPLRSPSPRASAGMAYDRRLARVVLMGGYETEPFNVLSDTWIYDGTTWTELNNVGSPGARSLHRMVYDESRQTSVLFGGLADFDVMSTDTWELGASGWTRRDVAGPVGRHSHGLSYDRTRQRVLLFGGEALEGMLTDTWALDRAGWHPVNVEAPKFEGGGALVYDPIRLRTILVGYAQLFELAEVSPSNPPERCEVAGVDTDGDGLAGCDDPDCAFRCTPTCAPLTSCNLATEPHCGDGGCAEPLEDYRICPADCTP